MIKAITGEPALLELQLFDGATDRYPQAYVRNSTGALVFTVPLTHVGLGLYDGFFTPIVEDYYTATFIVYTDAGHTLEDLYYERTEDIYLAESPSTYPTVEDIVDGVWDEQMLDHSINGSFGIHFQVIRQFTENITYELIDPAHGLQVIMDNITNQGVLDRIEINQNEVKIDQIIPAVNAARDAVISEVNYNQILIEGADNHLSTVDTHLTNEINQNEVKIDQAIAMIGTIQNNTTTRFIVPEQMMRPESGIKHYQFHLRLYDEMGNAEAPDTTPLIRVRNIETGVDIINNAPMTQDGVKVGAYYFVYPVSSGALLEHFLVEATVVENGSTRYVPAVTEITEYQSDLAEILAAVNEVDTIVSTSQNMLTNPIYGLNALHNDHIAITNQLNVIDSEVDHITAVVDALPTNLATKPDVQAVLNAVNLLPTLTQIQNALEFVRQQIMGVDNRDNTEIFNKIDFTGLLHANDPRLNYLDAYISSRSTLTAQQVWTYATRTLTSITLPMSEWEKVWNVLTSSIVTPNSIGQYILNMLDAPVSSRATFAQVQALLVGVAQETSVQQAIALIQQDIVNGTLCCANLTNLLNAIKAHTDFIPPDPATEQNVTDSRIALAALINNLALVVSVIKTYTDRIPLDPAHESTVSGIPHNPVLATDPRLAYLDVAVSSRAANIDLSGLATHADVSNSTNTIVTQINQNEVKIDNLQVSVNQKPNQSYFDTKFSTLATSAQLTAAKNEILNAMPEGGATAEEIWTYITRTLTTPFPDISNLATKDDVKYNQYKTKFSTTYRVATGDQELIVWGEKDGQRSVSSSNCNVNIKNSGGTTIWSALVSNPNSDGVYRFIHSISASDDSNYYIVISMVMDGVVRTTQQAFFTIGC